MKAEELNILPSDKSPEVYLSPEGLIRIKGRGFMFNNTELPKKIMEWIDLYLSNPGEITYINIKLEYLNSYTTTILLSILKKLTLVNLKNKKLIIRWYFEPDDTDILERGEYLSSTLNIPFEFRKTISNSE